MKIIVVSDTHGSEVNLEYVLENEKPFDRLIHLGDVDDQDEYIEVLAECPCDFVRGNCDYLSDLPAEVVVTFEEKRALITHGHYYYVSYGEEEILEEARQRGVQLVMYGHTHMPSVTDYGDMIVMNPGSLTFPRQKGRRPSYIILEIQDGKVDAEIMYL